MTRNYEATKNLRMAKNGDVEWDGKTYFSVLLINDNLARCLVEVKELCGKVLTVEASGVTLYLHEVCRAKAVF